MAIFSRAAVRQPSSAFSDRCRFVRFLKALGFAVVWGLAGCGLETYEQRLQATKGYFAYLDKLNQNLSPPWKSPPIDELRVPKQFQEIPAPQPITNSQGKLEFSEVDPRQPGFLPLRIDGLAGAWQAPVDVTVENQRESRTAYIYAATNTQLFLSNRATDALAFVKNLADDVANAIRIEAKQQPPATYPIGHSYAPRLSYEVKEFHFAHEVSNESAPYDVDFYAVQHGDNQVALIIFLPRGMDSQSRLAERIPLMLESLRVSSARPQGAPGGAPVNPGTPTSTPSF